MPPTLPGLDPDLTAILALGSILLVGWALMFFYLARRPDPEREHYTDHTRPTNGVPDDG